MESHVSRIDTLQPDGVQGSAGLCLNDGVIPIAGRKDVSIVARAPGQDVISAAPGEYVRARIAAQRITKLTASNILQFSQCADQSICCTGHYSAV